MTSCKYNNGHIYLWMLKNNVYNIKNIYVIENQVMKTKLIHFALFAALAFIAVGCGDNDLPEVAPHKALKETSWKLVGIMDVQTGSLTELEPRDCEVCYTLTFDTDTTFSSFSSANKGWGIYNYNCETHSFSVTGHIRTMLPERGEGEYWMGILESTPFFTVLEHELRLYYNEKQNYLLFILQSK